MRKKKKREKKNRFHPQSNSGPSTRRAVSLPLRHVGQYYETGDSILFKTSPRRTSSGAPCIKLIEPF